MKKMLFVIGGVYLSCSLFAQDEAQKMDSLILKNASNAEFCGSVLVAKAGKIVLHKGYGYSHEEQKIPNDAHTVYCIASITKTFTAALVLKLEEQGKLSVTDNINRYLPGFPNGEKITIRQLLTHTSGIPDYLRDKGFQSIDQSKPITQEEMMNFFKNKPPDFDPGTSFRYSNAGYTILGYIIEKVTGTAYADALANYIFKPLHMEHTTYGPPQGDRNKPATGYMMYYNNFKRTSPVVHASVSYSTGAIYSTVGDLYKWHQALQKKKFLTEQTLATAYKKDKGNYGYGWFTDSLYGKQRVSHDGNIPGYRSNINRFPQDDVCVIALSNSNNSAVGGLVRNMVNIMFHQPLPPAFANLPVIQMADSAKRDYEGVYRFKKEDATQVTVNVKDDKLLMTIAADPAFELLPVGKDVFKSGEARIEFKRNNTGRIQQIWFFNKGELAQVTKMD
jgi:CubicO group peptidase (beta-lactamase class C family)